MFHLCATRIIFSTNFVNLVKLLHVFFLTNNQVKCPKIGKLLKRNHVSCFILGTLRFSLASVWVAVRCNRKPLFERQTRKLFDVNHDFLFFFFEFPPCHITHISTAWHGSARPSQLFVPGTFLDFVFHCREYPVQCRRDSQLIVVAMPWHNLQRNTNTQEQWRKKTKVQDFVSWPGRGFCGLPFF